MKTTTFIFLLLLGANFSFAQVVFSETFDEADDANDGLDAIAAVPWSTTCPGSVAADDYFKVASGKLEARDTNGPAATWETGVIDISSCTGVSISLSLEEVSNMEECASCPGLTGTGCIDWVKLEYNLDAGGWTDVAGITCALTESPGEMIQIGDIAAGPLEYTSPCIDMGTTLQLRISCMCWAGAEMWRFDNITVSCLDCVLPVEVIDLEATKTDQNTTISWSTLNERSSDYFALEKSSDGIHFELIEKISAAGNSTNQIDYLIEDFSQNTSEVVYYRLKQFDLDGKETFSEIITIEFNQGPGRIFFGNETINYQFKNVSDKSLTIRIYDLNGKLVFTSPIGDSGAIPWENSGFFIVKIDEIDFRQKLIITPK